MIHIDNKTGDLQIVGDTIEILDEVLNILDNLTNNLNKDREKYLYIT